MFTKLLVFIISKIVFLTSLFCMFYLPYSLLVAAILDSSSGSALNYSFILTRKSKRKYWGLIFSKGDFLGGWRRYLLTQ